MGLLIKKMCAFESSSKRGHNNYRRNADGSAHAMRGKLGRWNEPKSPFQPIGRLPVGSSERAGSDCDSYFGSYNTVAST